jgi:hypothetical protein
MSLATVHYLSMNARNGKITVPDTITSGVDNTYTITSTSPNTAYYINWGDSTVSSVGPFTVTNKVKTTTVATLIVPNHTFIVGQPVTVSGVDATFNGTYFITAIGGSGATTTISYALSGAAVSTTAVSPAGSVVRPSSDADGTLTSKHIYATTGSKVIQVVDNVTSQIEAQITVTVV